MPAKSTQPAQLTPAMHHILLALLRAELHGYAIMQAIETLTDGGMRLGPGTLYTSLRKLLDAGLVEESGERPDDDDERRRYYRISSAGRAAVVVETQRLAQLVRFANKHARGVLA
ncbi:PadR family transcriptional regulator [soil metagenome]